MNKLIFNVVGVAAVATLFCVGCNQKTYECSSADGSIHVSSTSQADCEALLQDQPGLDSKLVCAEGEGWTYTITNENGTFQLASILSGDGTFKVAEQILDGENYYWAVFATGTWSTSGGNVTTTVNIPGRAPETSTGPYSVSGDGNTATISVSGKAETYTKGKVTIES